MHGKTVIAKFDEIYRGTGKNYEKGVGNSVEHGLVGQAIEGVFGFEASTKTDAMYDRLVDFYQNEENRKHVPLDVTGYSRGAFSAIKLVQKVLKDGIPDLGRPAYIVYERRLVSTQTVRGSVEFSYVNVPLKKYHTFDDVKIRSLAIISAVGQMGATPLIRLITFGKWNTNFGWSTTLPSGIATVTQLIDNEPNNLIYPQTTITYPSGSGYSPPVSPDTHPTDPTKAPEPFLDHPGIGVSRWTWDRLKDASRGYNVPLSDVDFR